MRRAGLISALCGAKDWDGAEAELNRLLADPAVSDEYKAAAAQNTAFAMMIYRRKDGARKWFEYVIEHFPTTQYAKLAKDRLSKGLTMPWEEKAP
jgi:hypothetical protein